MPDEQTLKALAFVRVLVGKMQMDVEANLAPNDGESAADEIRIEIEGADSGRTGRFHLSDLSSNASSRRRHRQFK